MHWWWIFECEYMNEWMDECLHLPLQSATVICTVTPATSTWLFIRPLATPVEEFVMTVCITLWATIVSSASPSSTSILRGTSVIPTSASVRVPSHLVMFSSPFSSPLPSSVPPCILSGLVWTACLPGPLNLFPLHCGRGSGGGGLWWETPGLWNVPSHHSIQPQPALSAAAS